jgi:hypothetical protein
LKKRSKKLSFIAGGMAFELENSERSVTDKSFLVLFFKKELLSFFCCRYDRLRFSMMAREWRIASALRY